MKKLLLDLICDLITYKKRKNLSNRLTIKKLSTPPG